MYKILAIGDGYAETGFARVIKSIFKYFPQDEFDIHHLAVNYWGDPHDNWWKMYPAAYSMRGDLLGYKRIAHFAESSFDLIFILNDVWVIKDYLKLIKKEFKVIPKIYS